MSTINYELLGEASEYYSKLGYQYLEVPWYASKEAISVTTPAHKEIWVASLGDTHYNLVGSAEQSLLDMLIQDKLPPGNYHTITPCWRDDPPDKLHQQYFMKLELMTVIGNEDEPTSDKHKLCLMVNHAIDFFSKYLEVLTVEFNDGSIDLVSDVAEYELPELGSYGIREYQNHKWVYGTGVAEPRLSTVVKLLEEY